MIYQNENKKLKSTPLSLLYSRVCAATEDERKQKSVVVLTQMKIVQVQWSKWWITQNKNEKKKQKQYPYPP